MRTLPGLLVLMVGIFLITTLSVRAEPAPPPCTDLCKQTSVGYSCKLDEVWIYEQMTCLPCYGIPGWTTCQPPTDGGNCFNSYVDMQVTPYKKGFQVCPDACKAKSKATGNTPGIVEGMPVSDPAAPFPSTRYVCEN